MSEGEIKPHDLEMAAERTKSDAELIKEGAGSYEEINGQIILRLSREKIEEIHDDFKKETFSRAIKSIHDALIHSQSNMIEAAGQLEKLTVQDLFDLTSEKQPEDPLSFIELGSETSYYDLDYMGRRKEKCREMKKQMVYYQPLSRNIFLETINYNFGESGKIYDVGYARDIWTKESGEWAKKEMWHHSINGYYLMDALQENGWKFDPKTFDFNKGEAIEK